MTTPLDDYVTVEMFPDMRNLAYRLLLSQSNLPNNYDLEQSDGDETYTNGLIAFHYSTGVPLGMLPWTAPKTKWTVQYPDGFTISAFTARHVPPEEEPWLKMDKRDDDWIADRIVALWFHKRPDDSCYVTIHGTITGERFRKEGRFRTRKSGGRYRYVPFTKLDHIDRTLFYPFPPKFEKENKS